MRRREMVDLISTSPRFNRKAVAALLFAATCIFAFFAFVAVTNAAGATQISGTGFFNDLSGECIPGADDVGPEGQAPDFALRLTGDLQGCHYVFVETAQCSPSGTYRETGTELFVGNYGGESGRFRTTYRFEAKYEDCETLDTEIFGRCQHPIIAGTGEDVFEGVGGRLDFKDDIEAGNFPYRGHLRW